MMTPQTDLHPLLQAVERGATPGLDDFVAAFSPLFPLLGELKDTQQDPEWHAEGDVHEHTQRVLEQTYRLLGHQAARLSQQERLVLVLAALFHDVAKPVTTRTRIYGTVERLVSPGHADKGRSYIAYKLLDLGLGADTARAVMAVVGHHHDPRHLILKNAPTSHYKRLARLAPLQLLYWLEQADLRGRVANDLDEQLDILELFKFEAEAAGVWQAVDPYLEWKSYLNQELSNLPERTRDFIVANAIRDYERGLIYTPQEAIARSFSYRDRFANLVITCGPSGSGKSTWLSETYPDYVVVSLDVLREELTGRREDQSQNGQVIQAAKERLRDCLRNHRNVAWDATSLIGTQRASVAQLGLNYKAEVTLAVFHVAESIIEQHNRQRPYPVPAGVLGKQLSNLNFPYLDEAHKTLYVS